MVLLSFLTLPSLCRGMSADPMVVALESELNSLRQALGFRQNDRTSVRSTGYSPPVTPNSGATSLSVRTADRVV